MARPVTFNVQRLIAAVAAEHHLLLKPDDAAFAIVTMSRLVLEESLEAVRQVIAEDLAQFKQTAQWAHSRAESAVRRWAGQNARSIVTGSANGYCYGHRDLLEQPSFSLERD